MADRKPPVGVGGARLKVMDRKVPRNPKYEHIGPTVQTGKTIRQVEVLSNQSVARRKGEVFKRMKATTVGKLLEQDSHKESIYSLGRDDEEVKVPVEDTASVYSAAQSTTSAVTLATEQLGLTVSATQADTEFLLLDLREPEEYAMYHIKDAISFPAPNITRDRLLPEVYRFVCPTQKNRPDKMIIVYSLDERRGVDAAQKFALKGFDNLFFISGGIEEFAKHCYHLLEGASLPPKEEDKPATRGKRSSSLTSTRTSAFRDKPRTMRAEV